MFIPIFKHISFCSLFFLLLQPAYAVQLVLNGYGSDDEAFDTAVQLKNQKIIKKIIIQGLLSNNKWEYYIIIADNITLHSAQQLKLNNYTKK